MTRAENLKNMCESKIYYHASHHPHSAITGENAKVGSAFGKGIYLSTLPEDAATWGEYQNKVRIKGKILELGLADAATIKKFEKVLNTDRFSKSDEPVPAILLFMALERKFPGKASAVLKKIGFVGVEHASPRLQFQNKATNVVVYDPKDVEIVK